MTVFTKITVNAVDFTDYQNLRVKKKMHDSNASSSFSATFDSPFGRHSSTFTVGETIEVFVDETDATTLLFTGIIEKLRFKGKNHKEKLTISGRDLSLRLQDLTAEPQVFTNTEVSSIVTTLLSSNNVPDITTNNVNVTSTTLSRMSYNHESLFDAFKELALLSNSIFYVDENKDLHWEERKSISTGVTLGDSQDNLISSDLDRSRQKMANIVWVYGDRYLSGFIEELSATGSADYTLLSRPHNTEVSHLGATLKGSIKNITITPTSGPDYEVNFFDRIITFLSGTDIGYDSRPADGGSILFNYKRELPIVKRGQDDDSINFYGPKVRVIRDKTIQDPNTALDILRTTLLDSNPLNRLGCQLKGFFTFNPGETVIYNLNNFNLTNLTMSIVEINYLFDKNTVNDNTTVSLVLSRKLLDITDQISDIDSRLRNLESEDISDTDVITRLMTSKEETTVVGSVFNISTRTLGSSFIIGKGPHGVTGPTFGGILGSIIESGINFLGDSRSALTLQFSGGNDYSVTGSYNVVGSEPPGGFGTLSSDYG